VVVLLEIIQLRFLKRGTGVSDDTAATFADRIVKGKIFSDDIFRNQDVSDLDDGSEIIPVV
jgi:hypothetical protein